MLSTGALLTLTLFLLAEPILTLFGATGETLRMSAEYVRVIALGAIFQLLATGFVPFIRNMNGSTFAMVAMILGFLTNVALDFTFVWVLSLGMAGAVYGCIGYVTSIIYLLLQGVGDGCQPLISLYYGKKDSVGVKHTVGAAYITALAISFVCMAGVFFARGKVGNLFGASGDANTGVIRYLPYFLAPMLFLAFVRITTSYYYATEKNILSYTLVYAEPILTFVLLLILPASFALEGVWLAVPIAQ